MKDSVIGIMWFVGLFRGPFVLKLFIIKRVTRCRYLWMDDGISAFYDICLSIYSTAFILTFMTHITMCVLDNVVILLGYVVSIYCICVKVMFVSTKFVTSSKCDHGDGTNRPIKWLEWNWIPSVQSKWSSGIGYSIIILINFNVRFRRHDDIAK